MSKWFGVEVGLRQGCVMLPWLFNMYMDGVVKGMAKRIGDDWPMVNQPLYADVAVIIADSAENLKDLLVEFIAACKKRNLKLNTGKIRVMVNANTGRRDH